MDRKRVHAARKFRGQDRVNHPVTLDTAFFAKSIGHDGDSEMSFAARAMAGVADVLVGFVNHFETLRRESLGQLVRDEIAGRHGICLGRPRRRVNYGCGVSR